MKITRRLLTTALGMLAAALIAPNGSAQCVAASQAHIKPTSLLLQPGVRLMPAAFFNDSEDDAATIVGFWRQLIISEGSEGLPDGTVLEQGLAQWHRDHTEIALNGSKPPSTGNLCMGIWEKVGERSYKLSHFVLNWDTTGTVYLGPARFQTVVTLSKDGQHFRGRFTLDQYDPSGKTLLRHYQGFTTANRITVNSTPDIFSN